MQKDKEKLISLYREYVNCGGVISPMNTETCRKYLHEKMGRNVSPEEVLWLFYHVR